MGTPKLEDTKNNKRKISTIIITIFQHKNNRKIQYKKHQQSQQTHTQNGYQTMKQQFKMTTTKQNTDLSMNRKKWTREIQKFRSYLAGFYPAFNRCLTLLKYDKQIHPSQ